MLFHPYSIVIYTSFKQKNKYTRTDTCMIKFLHMMFVIRGSLNEFDITNKIISKHININKSKSGLLLVMTLQTQAHGTREIHLRSHRQLCSHISEK